MSVTRITTETGSIYNVRLDAEGRFWLSADNVPNPTFSRPLQDGEWQIVQPRPWPPELGERLWLVSMHYRQPDHPLRLPGGGKLTSPIRSVEAWDPSKAAA